MSARIATLGEQVLARMEAVNAARERALGESRQVVRLCANCIRAAHRNDVAGGQKLAAEARDRLSSLAGMLRDHPAISMWPTRST